MKKPKRDHKHPTHQSSPNSAKVNVHNRFKPLESNGVDEPDNTNTYPKILKSHPNFIYGVNNYKSMIDNLASITEQETYHTKALADETVKIIAHIVDTYRKIVRHLREKNIIHHTYQLKEDRAYRIVIRNLHHSVPVEEIKEELAKSGHKVRNVLNIKHRLSKKSLSMFYVELEP